MFFRNAALAAGLLVLVVALSASTAGAARDRTPPTTPTNLRITATGPTSISLAWDASTDNSGNFWYIVQGCGGSIRVNRPQTTFSNTRLWPSRTYPCSVYALDPAGNRSGNSNTVSYTTPPDTTPPAPPPTVTATSVRPTRIWVSWTESIDNVSQVWYTLFVNGSVHLADQIGYREATVLNLTPSTTYVFRVTARDAFGNIAESNVLSVTTPVATDTVPPTARRSAVGNPLRGVSERQAKRRRGDRIRLDHHLLPCPWADHDRDQGSRYLRERVGTEQRDRFQLLGTHQARRR